MKKYTPIILLSCLFQLLTNIGYSQDNIILKNGDEIAAKVLEVTTDQIKYKKWENQEGPTYTSAKSEVFMIKYKNGTKDVFNTASSTPNTANSGDKFIGNWLPKRGDRGGVKERLTISKAGQGYLINYSRIEDAGGGMFINDGSFKETGQIEGSNLVVNSFLKLSLLNDNTILMQSEEFVKQITQVTNIQEIEPQNKNLKVNSSNTTDLGDPFEKGIPGALPTYTPYYHSLDSITKYNIWDNCFFYKSNKPIKAKEFLVDFKGIAHTSAVNDLKVKIGAWPWVGATIITSGFELKDKKYSYTISSCITTKDNHLISKRENIEFEEKKLSNSLQAIHLAHYYKPEEFPADKNLIYGYINFEVKDNFSDFIIIGFCKVNFYRE